MRGEAFPPWKMGILWDGQNCDLLFAFLTIRDSSLDIIIKQ
jgi:hypothetical protein